VRQAASSVAAKARANAAAQKPWSATSLKFPPTAPGLLGMWEYSRYVRRALLGRADGVVHFAKYEARRTTSAGVNGVAQLASTSRWARSAACACSCPTPVSPTPLRWPGPRR
jgi:hypothetical protein